MPDCLYLAVGQGARAAVVTADKLLAARGRKVGLTMMLLGDDSLEN